MTVFLIGEEAANGSTIGVNRTTDIGSSGGVHPFDSSTIKKSRTSKEEEHRSYSVPFKNHLR